MKEKNPNFLDDASSFATENDSVIVSPLSRDTGDLKDEFSNVIPGGLNCPSFKRVIELLFIYTSSDTTGGEREREKKRKRER